MIKPQMENSNSNLSVQDDNIIRKIYWIRGEKVMLDEDLAELYGVPVKRLKEAVRRNLIGFLQIFYSN
jgi:hypothetical protein